MTSYIYIYISITTIRHVLVKIWKAQAIEEPPLQPQSKLPEYYCVSGHAGRLNAQLSVEGGIPPSIQGIIYYYTKKCGLEFYTYFTKIHMSFD